MDRLCVDLERVFGGNKKVSTYWAGVEPACFLDRRRYAY